MAVLGALAAGGPAAAGPFLPFVDPPGPDGVLRSPPRLLVSAGGGRQVRAVLDTGSVGVVLAAAVVPDWQALPVLGPARIAYTSSGRVMEGTWVTTRVTVAGRDGAAVTTEPMPVMVVTALTCLPRARSCVPDRHPRHVAMLGVGFARGDAAPGRNPLLLLPGAGRPGYVLTGVGVTPGLGEPESHAAFRTMRLQRAPGAPDWSAPPVCISVAGHHPPACGTLLVDTGVSRGFLTVPQAQLDGAGEDGDGSPSLRAGTMVTLEAGGGTAPRWGYTFRVGDPADPAAPAGVTLVGTGRRPTFVNTSLHLLNRFDYLYDAEQGLVGFRARD